MVCTVVTVDQTVTIHDYSYCTLFTQCYFEEIYFQVWHAKANVYQMFLVSLYGMRHFLLSGQQKSGTRSQNIKNCLSKVKLGTWKIIESWNSFGKNLNKHIWKYLNSQISGSDGLASSMVRIMPKQEAKVSWHSLSTVNRYRTVQFIDQSSS